MTIYETYVSVEDHVSGNRKHGTIYPQFSRLPVMSRIMDGENLTEIKTRRVSVEDGTFEKASNRIGFTGQHTDLIPDGGAKIAYVIGGMIITSNSPYIKISGYSRNKYGGRCFEARLDCERGVLQRPITRGGKTTYHDFIPAQYID